jgi:hypothetical protein
MDKKLFSTDDKVLAVVSRRHSYMLDFWQSMEGIRWRFTSTFGVGAIVALFLSIDQLDREKSLVPLVVLFTLSVASIICQLRVYGVLHSVWQKMILLQKLEIDTLKNLGSFPAMTEENERAFYFPQPLPSKIRLASITGVSCSVFVLLATLAIYLCMRLFNLSILWSLLISGIFLSIAFILVIIGLNKSSEYHYQSTPSEKQLAV